MARIRSIKPEFWTDGKIISLPFAARLLFIGSWNFARCDRGHLDDDAVGLRLRVMPADPVDADSLLKDIINSGLIERREVGGRKYLIIKRFTDHQKIDQRWDTRCPYCSLELDETLQDSPKLTETHRNSAQERKGEEGKGKYRKGEEGKFSTSHEEFLKEIAPLYPHINIQSEFGKMKAWIAANPHKKRSLSSKRFIVNWLNRIEAPLDFKPKNGHGFNSANQAWLFVLSEKTRVGSTGPPEIKCEITAKTVRSVGWEKILTGDAVIVKGQFLRVFNEIKAKLSE